MIIKQAVTKFKDGIELICLGEWFFDGAFTPKREKAVDVHFAPPDTKFFLI